MSIGSAYAVIGRKPDTQKLLDQLNELSKRKYVPALYSARIYVALG
jgi:hypothetical protein